MHVAQAFQRYRYADAGTYAKRPRHSDRHSGCRSRPAPRRYRRNVSDARYGSALLLARAGRARARDQNFARETNRHHASRTAIRFFCDARPDRDDLAERRAAKILRAAAGRASLIDRPRYCDEYLRRRSPRLASFSERFRAGSRGCKCGPALPRDRPDRDNVSELAFVLERKDAPRALRNFLANDFSCPPCPGQKNAYRVLLDGRNFRHPQSTPFLYRFSIKSD